MTTSTPTRRDRSTAERALIVLEILLAVGAYFGAFGLVVEGVDMGEATARLPFGSMVFAGVALGLINGVLPTVVVVGALRNRPWATLGHLVVGVVLMGWIVVQVAILGPPVHWLQILYFIWGAVLLALALHHRREIANRNRIRP